MIPDRFQLIQRTLNRRQPDLTVLADGIHKSRNIAAIVRSCDAVGALNMHVVAPGGDIPRHHATNAGSKRWSRLYRHNTIEAAVSLLKTDGFQIVAAHLSDSTTDFRDIDYCQPTALLLGNEVEGVSQTGIDSADKHIMIPMMGMVESLNVSVAAALVLYEAQRQREKAGMYDECRIPHEEYQRILFEWSYPRIARRCREKRRPYPNMDVDGQMLSNPLAN